MPEQIEQLQQFAVENNIVPCPSLPEVPIPGFGSTLLEASERIYTAIKPSGRFFIRLDFVVELKQHDTGEVEFKILSTSAARSTFESYVRFIKKSAKGDVGSILPKDITEAILHCSTARDILPHIDYLAQAPVLVDENGRLRTITGMDEAHRIYVSAGGIQYPESLEEAVQTIETVLCDFQFTEESDISRAIAAILTPAMTLGGLLKLVPAFMFEADHSQAGKGYLAKLIFALYREQPRIITQRTGGVGSLDESIGSALFSGSSFILLDNLRQGLDSPYLEALLTAQGMVTARIPYQAEVKVDPRRRIIILTANGIKMTEDMVNRLCAIRLKKDFDLQPKTIDGKDMLETVQTLQPHFLGCVFKVIEEWNRLGRPRTEENRHSFREWAQSLDWIVQNIFHLPPLLDGHDGIGDRLRSPNLMFLEMLSRNMAALATPGTEYSASDLAQAAQGYNITIPGLGKENQANTEAGAKLIGVIMAALFSKEKSFSTDQGTWNRERKTRGNPNGGNPFESWVYTFQKKNDNQEPPLPPCPIK